MVLTPGIRGLDNQNPLNIKQGASPWAGSTGKDERGHTIFTDPAYSVRALLRLGWVYMRRYKLRTLEDIFSRYAPASDTQGSIAGRPQNDPNAYAAYVARTVGVPANKALDIFDSDGRVQPRIVPQLIDGIAAMVTYECGAEIYFDRSMYMRGIGIYHRLLKKGDL